jgi:hypothetical protein
VTALEKDVLSIKNAPAQNLVKAKDGFLKGGADMATKSVWTIFFGFVGFLVWNYIQKGGL